MPGPTAKNDPASQSKRLGELPSIHRTASVRDCTFGAWCEVGARTKLAESSFGDFTYVMNNCDVIYAELGRFCSIAAGVRLNPGNHPLDRVALNHFTYRSSAYGMGDDDSEFFAWRRRHRVVLGNDVWIGHGAIVLPGVRIGTGAAIGAGSIVTKDVPPFAVAIGTPARVHRLRFSESVIAALHRIAWWDWPHDRLRGALMDFRHLGAEAFCAKWDPGGDRRP